MDGFPKQKETINNSSISANISANPGFQLGKSVLQKMGFFSGFFKLKVLSSEGAVNARGAVPVFHIR
jgi:hypothetical protein